MSRIYTSLDAAEELGTTPRLLRRFIRENDSWTNATYAGRYSFTESDVAALRRDFTKWRSQRPTRKHSAPKVTDELTYLDEDKGIAPEEMSLMKTNPAFRRAVLARRQERFRKLEARIRETGIRNSPQRVYEDA